MNVNSCNQFKKMKLYEKNNLCSNLIAGCDKWTCI